MNASINTQTDTSSTSNNNRSATAAAITTVVTSLGSVLLSQELQSNNNGKYPTSCVIINELPVELKATKFEPINGNWKKNPPDIVAAPTPNELLRLWKLSGEAPESVDNKTEVDELSPKDDDSLNFWISRFGDKEGSAPFKNYGGYIVKSQGNGAYANAIYEFDSPTEGSGVKYRLILAMRNHPRTRNHTKKQTYGFGLWRSNSNGTFDNNTELEKKYKCSKDKNYAKQQLLSEYVLQHKDSKYDYACGYTTNNSFTKTVGSVTVTANAADASCTYTITIKK